MFLHKFTTSIQSYTLLNSTEDQTLGYKTKLGNLKIICHSLFHVSQVKKDMQRGSTHIFKLKWWNKKNNLHMHKYSIICVMELHLFCSNTHTKFYIILYVPEVHNDYVI